MFELEFLYYDDNDDEKTAVIRYNYKRGRLANTTYGHPDDWSPAEPSEIDVLDVFIDDTKLSELQIIEFCKKYGEDFGEEIQHVQNKYYYGVN